MERRQASRLPAFFAADLRDRHRLFLLRALELFAAGCATFEAATALTGAFGMH